jgi:tetratricopeptide (TPR) repeat protein
MPGHRSSVVLLVILSMGVFLSTGILGGCGQPKKQAPRRERSSQSGLSSSTSHDRSTGILLESIAATLNDLPREIDLELQPPQVVLDASKSGDQKQVQAICSVNPEVPDGPYNFIQVVSGNANFRRLRVRAGDIVRYYIHVDQESREHGITKRKYLQLPVRRLDTRNPENALIVEGGLTGPVTIPERLEIWRYSDKRMNEIRKRISRYMKLRLPVVAWEPTPDEATLSLLVDRINLWLRSRPALNSGQKWQLDPLLTTLPKSLRISKEVAAPLQENSLREGFYSQQEGRLLQQAIWLRDISAWAFQHALTDVDVASALFDWTIRNLQLDASDKDPIVFHPWQALMYGHGTAKQRAWVFAELCRQQQLDVVILTTASDPEEETHRDGAQGEESSDGRVDPAVQVDSDSQVRHDGQQEWLVALWSEGQFYLFDTQLGLPIPGTEIGSVATLVEIQKNPALLRRLDLDPEHPYRIDANALTHVEASLIASPLQLSRRALLLENYLEGEHSVVLAADNRRLTEELKQHDSLAGVKLWTEPFRAIRAQHTIKPTARQQAALRIAVFAQRPKLWKARVLHFQGLKPIPYELRDDPLAEPNRGHRDALRLYQDRSVRPSDQQLSELQPSKQILYRTAKLDASYWLGLLCYDMQKYSSAVNWLKNRTLDIEPLGSWAASAQYNLARTYEAEGECEKAIGLLKTGKTLQHHGNQLRARQLSEQSGEEESVSEETD